MANDILQSSEKRMQVSAVAFKNELATIRTGRASPALIEHIKVDYAGVPTPINQLASIAAPESRLLVIQPWDKSCIGNIEKAILKSELGLNPASDGNVIRITIPSLNDERRQELIRVVRKKLEERRVAIRNLRRDAVEAVKALEKDKTISQDESRRALDRLQKITDFVMADIDKIGQSKEAELKEV
ncbi:MAG: ribosome recycling factor [Dehalococcoidales bacterium]|nr:ribosome recycling factor [Dehalococcoidales bacterium]